MVHWFPKKGNSLNFGQFSHQTTKNTRQQKLLPTFNLTKLSNSQAILDDVEFISDKVDFFDRLLAPGDAEYDFYFGADGHTTDEASRNAGFVESWFRVSLSRLLEGFLGGSFQMPGEVFAGQKLEPTNSWKMVFVHFVFFVSLVEFMKCKFVDAYLANG